MSWSDDFNRADGPIDNNWIIVGSGATITSNKVTNTGTGVVLAPTAAEPGAHTAELTIGIAGFTGFTCNVLVKSAIDGTSYYFLRLNVGASLFYAQIYKHTGGGDTQLVNQLNNVALGTLNTMALTYSGGTLTATVNGASSATASDSALGANGYVGMGNVSIQCPVDAFSTTIGVTASMEVTPDPLWVGGGDVAMLATGTGTGWTPGVPGSSTISADHGTVSDQWTESATLIHFTYTPADYVGAIVFTESQGGLTDTVNGTVVPQEGQGGLECRLTADGASMVNTTAAHTTGDLVTSDAIVGLGIGGAPNLTFISAIADLWYAEFRTAIDPPSGYQGSDLLSKLWLIINGGYDPAVGPWPQPSGSTLKQDTEVASSRLVALTDTYTDLATLAGDLGGSPVLYSHADLKLQLDAIQLAGNQDVLDMLSSMWGTSTPTLTDIATLISDISTIAGYTLGDVLTAIAAQDVSGARADILAAIAALRGDNVATVSGVASLLSDVNDAVQEVKVSLQELRTPSAYTFQDVLDAIAALPAQIGAAAPGAPVWPGEASVTLGQAVALSTGLTITSPMDGVVVQITQVAPKLNGHAYTYHDILCYRNVGALAFFTDRGDVETYQALGFTTALYAPRYIARAAGVKLMCPAGTVGTVRPWTVNA